MKNEGYCLSFEAIASLAVLSLLVSVPLHSKEPDFANLQILKKEHDLLILWASEQVSSLEEMEKDFVQAFPGKSGTVFLDKETRAIGKPCREAVSAKGFFFDSSFRKREIGLVLFKDQCPFGFA